MADRFSVSSPCERGVTGCVLTLTAWECTGAASGAVASYPKLKWTTATSNNLPQRRPHCALPWVQCRPVKWTQFVGVSFHQIPREPHTGQCAHLSSGEISRMRKAARNALQICWRSPLQIALTAGCRTSWWKLDTRMEYRARPVVFQTYWLVFSYRYSKESDRDCPNFMNRKDPGFKKLTGALQALIIVYLCFKWHAGNFDERVLESRHQECLPLSVLRGTDLCK